MEHYTGGNKTPAPSTLKMPKTNLERAEFACVHARKMCTNRANNKYNARWKDKKAKRFVVANYRLNELRNEKSPLPGNLLRLETIAELASVTYKVGNCLEMCAVAFIVLMKMMVKPLAIVRHIRPGDHMFVVIGLANPDGVVKNEISTWGDNVAICDPWANIAVPASKYDSLWEERMVTWANKGKQVWFNEHAEEGVEAEKGAGDWASPAPGLGWFSAINKNAREVSYRFDG